MYLLNFLRSKECYRVLIMNIMYLFIVKMFVFVIINKWVLPYLDLLV